MQTFGSCIITGVDSLCLYLFIYDYIISTSSVKYSDDNCFIRLKIS